MHAHVDFETRSDVDLRKSGAFRYFESPNAKVLMCAYRIDDAPPQIWTYDQPPPADLCQAIEQGATLKAWNAQFESLGFDLLADRYGWPRPKLEQYDDTAAAAAAMSLPRALGDTAQALGVEVQKDKIGMSLIRKFSIPRRARKDEDPNGLYWNEPEDFPEDFEKFKSYCLTDIAVEEAIARRLVPLPDSERRLWALNERVNRIGIRVDVTSARSAINMADKAKKALDREMRIVTGGYVTACSQPGKLVEWVGNQGVEIGSAAKAEITDLLEADDLPANVRKALELRQEAAKTSVSKLNSMLARVNADGRIRGSSLYHGASTGRFQSAGVNFSNLPRSRPCYENVRPDTLFRAFKTEEPEILPFLWGDEIGRPLHLISDAIRGFIWSAPGHDLMQADYSGIEGAVIAWLAGEDWKLQALHEIIADPALPDMYRRTAAQIMGMSTDEITKKHPFRQSIGKTSELALGFGGSVSALHAMSLNYGVDLGQVYDPVWSVTDDEMRAKAVRRYEGQLKRGLMKTDVLPKNTWLACWLVVQMWRKNNPAIATMWRDLSAAVREAVQQPGTVTEAGRVKYRVAKGFLWALLPSGRCLAYGAPRTKDQVWAKVLLPDGSWSDAEVMDRDRAEMLERKGSVKIEGGTSPAVSALGVDSKTKKWRRFVLSPPIVSENNTQAVARDILVNGMWKATNAGYPIIASVYDEIICEVPRGWGSVGEFERLICELPEWADGLPLTAGGWRGKRYRKD